MKKFLVLAIALLIAACTTPSPTTNRDTNRNANAETKAAAPLTEADAIAKEKEAWSLLEKKDYVAFADMLDQLIVVVGGGGVSDKAATLKELNGYVPTDVVFSDWKFLPIDKDSAVIVYKAQYKATANGQPVPQQNVYASSAVVNRNGKWVAIFHQETDVAKGPPPPTPATKPATTKPATSSPSPSATVATTSADAEANEKLVWDALKKKNFDAFASYLAPEAIEVEPLGVNDKAASIKGVQGFDFSKTELSDWKVVRFDDDAALVTYLVRVPGQKPDRERHSTIWANKGGKWLAVFHQGTPQMPPPPAAPSPAASKSASPAK